ncbi:NOL1/NOP2/sun family protein [Histomonas meleagridis]|uniref:NOL1/NOP2/sun family protein n=1 Tax=Histomonas meleagridis TaxID=135588 RepID=UPI0035599EBC|nr:NOL1/NOP2/sun family protein [Histomonas meleagridis]
MIETFKTPLPTVFRLSTKPDNHSQLEAVLNKYIEDMNQHNYKTVEYTSLPSKFGRVFKIAIDKSLLRKTPELSEFNKWLQDQTSIGNCHRQEFVSMIPPHFLDVGPDDSVLDMCAAPGSKTGQILEMLNNGFIIANDNNARRCHDLVHQLQRIDTANALVTCQNAEIIDLGDNTKFDRVLCDVPCTGDGTCRKNPAAAAKWEPKGGIQLHSLQRNILLRGLELLKVGGICVYSTCSMNPIEDEAVVGSVISQLKGAVEIVNVSDKFTELKRHCGLKNWPVFDNEMKKFESFQEVPTELKETLLETMFPIEGNESVENCMRFYPQDDDSGAFFVAVIRKVTEFNRITVKPIEPPKPLKEAPFRCIDEINTDAFEKVNEIYDFSDELKTSQLFVRDETKVHSIYYVNMGIANLVKEIGYEKLRIINGGVRIINIKNLGKNQKDVPCPSQEGILLTFKFANKRKFQVTPKVLLDMLKNGNDGVNTSVLPADFAEQFNKDNMRTGAMFYIPDTHFIYSGVTAGRSIAIYLKKDLADLEILKLKDVYPELCSQ